MFVTLIILLFVAQPINGPCGAVSVHFLPYDTKAQIEEYQNENAAEYPYYGRFRHKFREFREEHHSAEVATQQGNDKENRRWNRVVGVATVILALVGIITWIVIYLQYRKSQESSAEQSRLFRDANAISREQNRLSHENSQLELRAYVSISGAIETSPIIDRTTHTTNGETREEYTARIPTARFILENSGQTPAYDVRFWVKDDFRNLTSTESFDETAPLDIEISRYPLISANGEVQPPPHVSRIPRQVPDDGNWPRIYYWGRIEYRDAFNRQCYTRFRMFISLTPTAEGLDTRVIFAEDGNGTETTDNQPRQKQD